MFLALTFWGTLLPTPPLRFPGRRWPTSRFVELQGDMGIEAQAEVVVEDVQGQLGRGRAPT